MKGRIPVLATLLPLILGVIVWAFVWRGYERAFEADLLKLLPSDTSIEARGFPYRLEAVLGRVAIARDDVALKTSLAVTEASVNRVPWQRDRQVVNLTGPVAELVVKPLQGATIRIEAPATQASVRLDGSRIARLSAIWDAPRATTGLIAAPLNAERLETHLRETPAAGGDATKAARMPTQVQLVVAATGLRIAAGDPLALALNAELTADRPIASLAGWAASGAVELRSATLTDGTGEVARMVASLSADGGRLRLTGVVETVCPATVRAAIAGLPPVSEQRSRKAERIAVSGTLPGGLVAAPKDPTRPPSPVRGQEPNCPRLR